MSPKRTLESEIPSNMEDVLQALDGVKSSIKDDKVLKEIQGAIEFLKNLQGDVTHLANCINACEFDGEHDVYGMAKKLKKRMALDVDDSDDEEDADKD
jgi:hypothetical protein